MQQVLASAECPDCAAEVVIEATVRAGEVVECMDCRSELEVVSVQPPILSPAPEVEEDWGE